LGEKRRCGSLNETFKNGYRTFYVSKRKQLKVCEKESSSFDERPGATGRERWVTTIAIQLEKLVVRDHLTGKKKKSS